MGKELNNELYKKYEREIEAVAKYLSINYFVPGLDQDDVKQEIRLHCWEAAHKFDPETGNHPLAFFRKVGIYHALNLRTLAMAKKRYRNDRVYIEDIGEPCSKTPIPEIDEEVEFNYLLGIDTKSILSDFEYETLVKYVHKNGYSCKDKSQDNARLRFVKKIRAEIEYKNLHAK